MVSTKKLLVMIGLLLLCGAGINAAAPEPTKLDLWKLGNDYGENELDFLRGLTGDYGAILIEKNEQLHNSAKRIQLLESQLRLTQLGARLLAGDEPQENLLKKSEQENVRLRWKLANAEIVAQRKYAAVVPGDHHRLCVQNRQQLARRCNELAEGNERLRSEVEILKNVIGSMNKSPQPPKVYRWRQQPAADPTMSGCWQ